MPHFTSEEIKERLAKRFGRSLSAKSDSSQISDLDHENEADYGPGGYHRVNMSELLNKGRYRIVEKLGWGYFSTVWLGFDYEQATFCALKICKSAKEFREAALDEIKILQQIQHGKDSAVVKLFDHFELRGEHGWHIAMVFELLGNNLLSSIQGYKYKGLPISFVKKIAKDLLTGLEQTHRASIIHCDLKPENILFRKLSDRVQNLIDEYEVPPREGIPLVLRTDLENLTKAQKKRRKKKLEELENEGISLEELERNHCLSNKVLVRDREESSFSVCLADFGNACWCDKQFMDDISTRQYKAPETIFHSPYGTSSDIFSAGCTIFELLTGSFLFQPQEGKYYTKEDDHLARMAETIEKFELSHINKGKRSNQFFNKKGDLRHIQKLREDKKLKDILMKKHGFDEKDATEINDFLFQMLRLNPKKRATAKELLQHPWLSDCVTDIDGIITEEVECDSTNSRDSSERSI